MDRVSAIKIYYYYYYYYYRAYYPINSSKYKTVHSKHVQFEVFIKVDLQSNVK